ATIESSRAPDERLPGETKTPRSRRSAGSLRPSISLEGGSFLGSFPNGGEDLGIAPATTEVAGQVLLEFLERWIGVFLEEPGDHHDHAGDAVTALEGSLVVKGLLHGVQLILAAEPLDRDDLLAVKKGG